MLFSLGARLTDVRSQALKAGFIGGAVRPIVCMAISWAVAEGFGLQGTEYQLLLIYGALPPAVLNFVLSERYAHEPERMAAIVLTGNLLAVITMPIALALVL